MWVSVSQWDNVSLSCEVDMDQKGTGLYLYGALLVLLTTQHSSLMAVHRRNRQTTVRHSVCHLEKLLLSSSTVCLRCVSLPLKLCFPFLPLRRSVSCVWNRTVLLEKYLTCRRRWSGRIKKLGYDLWTLFHFYIWYCLSFAWCWTSLLSLLFHNSLPLCHCCGSAQALERQKEYTDAIRTERDELREESVKLKDILKVLRGYVCLIPVMLNFGKSSLKLKRWKIRFSIYY